jgi:hypothetical protein
MLKRQKKVCLQNLYIYLHAGVRQSLSTVGSLVGSAVASAVFIASGHSYVVTFAAAAVPPVLALTWLAYTFRDEFGSTPATDDARAVPTDAAGADKAALGDVGKAVEGEKEVGLLEKAGLLVGAFKPAYWQAILVVSVLYFGRFDFAWVTLRAQAVRHLSLSLLLTAMPAGWEHLPHSNPERNEPSGVSQHQCAELPNAPIESYHYRYL